MSKFTISSDSFPEKDRVEATSHYVGALGGKVAFTPLSDDFRYHMTCRAVAGLRSVVVLGSPWICECAGDDNLAEYVSFGFNMDDYAVRYRGSNAEYRAGDFNLRILASPLTYRSEASAGAVIAAPAEELYRRLTNRNSVLAASLPRETPGLPLLRGYLDILNRDDALEDDLAHQVFASHVYDLMALVLGANSDALEQARHGGLRAARLKAAKDYVDAHLFDLDLSDRTIAAHLGVSDRYVRLLFAGEGTSCKTYIDAQRLAKAYAMLTNPVWAGLKIIDLAYRCGFNDITTFNRQFRARYGMTPSDARGGRQ
jgi:AraC-like DNA-binding protein